MDALEQLHRHGLTVRADGDTLIVEPRDRLTEELRNAIRTSKAEIMARLRAQQLDADDERDIRRWLAHIGETDEITIIEILAGCAINPDALDYFIWRSQEAKP